MKNTSIVLADSQYLIRVGLKHLLQSSPEFSIVGEATSEEQLLPILQEHRPDVVILDYNQCEKFKPSTVKFIKNTSPSSNILVISADHNKETIYEVLENGIHSYLTKRCSQNEIMDAVRATAKGEKFFCSTVIDFILEKSFAKQKDTTPTPLTPREIEIVRLVAKGLIAKEIASKLGLSTHTVYTHRKNIMKKLKLGTASEMVLYAVHQGIL